MDMEINGHEWWSWDGKTIWFDLQTPRSQVFWIAGVEMATGRKIRYHVERDWWGVHFNSSRDNTLFAGDGGDPSQVAYSTDGMWINLFRVQPGDRIAREKLADMSKHNYVTGRGGVEPNVHITPDKKWVVFTGQFGSGPRHVYAVEIERAKAAKMSAPRTSSARYARTCMPTLRHVLLISLLVLGCVRRAGDERRAGAECRRSSANSRATVRPFLNAYCASCHTGEKAAAQLDLRQYTSAAFGRAGFCEVGSRAREACRAADAAQAGEAAVRRRAAGGHQLDRRDLEDRGAQE